MTSPVLAQALPSIVTSMQARPLLPPLHDHQSHHVTKRFPPRDVRRLPKIETEVTSPPQSLARVRGHVRRGAGHGSPTLGEIALRRKIIDRLPTRKVKIWFFSLKFLLARFQIKTFAFRSPDEAFPVFQTSRAFFSTEAPADASV